MEATAQERVDGVDAYLGLSGVQARNRLTQETRVEVLTELIAREKRSIVTDRAKARLRVISAQAQETTEPEVAAPVVVAETPAPVVVVETLVPAPASAPPVQRDALEPPSEVDVVWVCTKCGHEGPPKDFGMRTVGGRQYRQPQCTSCRSKAAKLSTARRRAEQAERTAAFDKLLTKALLVDCPTCAAPVGEVCSDRTLHEPRTRLANESTA